ncbi:methionine aminopeptidase [Paenibacillus sp. FSL H7-689]|nr:methionine aminopeptidase [Paenibacillus sp. FSL H7-689]
MIILKSDYEIESIRKACQVVAECHRKIAQVPARGANV